MNCDFIKTLTPEQKEELRKLLNEDEQPQPKYRVEVEFYDKEKTKIKRLHEYLGDELHGICKCWYTSGQLEYEFPYQNGKWHGVCKCWYNSGQIQYEHPYQNSKTHGIRKHWDENGKLKHKEYWLYGNQVSKEEYEKLSKK